MNAAVYTALYSRLQGTALTALLAGTTSIYNAQAPEGAALPYVVFSQAGGGWVQDTQHTDANDVLYIRGYSETSMASAGSISSQIFTLLNRAPLTITGWSNSWLQGEAPHIEYAEPDESGKVIYSAGDHYRLRIDKT